MKNFKLVIAYDGTAYSGWQIQPNSLTIQEVLQEKLAILLKHKITIIGSGRTDAGVHALNQVAHFHFDGSIQLFRLQGALNALLPHDIRIKSIQEVPSHFHSQYSAIGKTYHYHLHLDRVLNPFRRLYSLHVREKIDLSLLKDASRLLLGTHDFTSFANEPHAGTVAHDPIRTLKRLDVFEQEGGVRLEFEADGFLYKMVRNLVGILLETASGKRKIEEISIILKAKDRRKAGKAVPPQGLFLVDVDYPALFSISVEKRPK